MRIRRAVTRDKEAAEAIHAEAGYEFKFPDIESDLTECAFVVEDDQGQPMVVAVAKRSPEIVMAMRKTGHPLVKLQALGMIHEALRKELEALGYDEAFSFLPPQLERNYARHLQRIFGWVPTWKGFAIRKKHA